MKINTLVAAAGVLALAASGWCQSGITTSGQVQLTAPLNSVLPGAYENNQTVDLFLENLDVVLPSNLSVDANQPGTWNSSTIVSPALLNSGAAVSSYYLHADPIVSTGTQFTGSITFSTNILGVIDSTALLAASDSILGTSGTAYSGLLRGRGFELSPGQDSFTISGDDRTLTFSAMTWETVDDMRIVTAAPVLQTNNVVSPEPASIGLAVLALGGGLWFRRRSTAR